MQRTTGDADGLGEIRKKELVKSGLQLGIGHKDDIMIIEDKSVCRPPCAGKQNR
jgi:N-acetylglucosaminylphosphatidylinositol deacetylase